MQPPLCDNQGNNLRRKKRQSDDDEGPRADFRIDHPSFARNATTVEVFGGFYVTDTTDSRDTRLFDGEIIEEVQVFCPHNCDWWWRYSFVCFKKNKEDQLCISPRDFAIGIAVAGLILMIAVVAAILFLCARRRQKRVSSTTGSSVYSGPYTNTAYSHSSWTWNKSFKCRLPFFFRFPHISLISSIRSNNSPVEFVPLKERSIVLFLSCNGTLTRSIGLCDRVL